MAEENPKLHSMTDVDELSRDDVSTLEFVLHHVKGASPSSLSLLAIDEISE